MTRLTDGRAVALGEAIPFSRANAARVLDISPATLNNWIDRNRLWETDRGIHAHRSYLLREIFDLAGFAQMRAAGIPEKRCATFIRNYGFYRSFCHPCINGEQLVQFSMRAGEWQLGVFDPNAVLTLTINMRVLASEIFSRIALDLIGRPDAWPRESFEGFSALYLRAVEAGRLPRGTVPHFERGFEP